MAGRYSRQIQSRINAALSVQNRQRLAAAAAARVITEATAERRQPPSAIIVDGRPGAPLATVNPDRGHIEVRFTLLPDVLRWIHDQLGKHSPVLSGAYAASHVWTVDGQPFDIDHPPEAREYVALSTVPYARKIERGESDQAPTGVYEVVAALAQARFGNIASIGFGFKSPLLDYVPGGKNRAERAALRNQPARLSAMRMERATRVPAITISVR